MSNQYQPVTKAEFAAHTSPRPGVLVIYQIILWFMHAAGATGGGIYNRRPRRGLSFLSWRTASLHAVGRAGDIMVPNKAVGDEVAYRLTAAATYIGVCEIIWNRQRWTVDKGWVAYHGTNQHLDHVHFGCTVDWADAASGNDYARWVTKSLGWA